MSAVRRIRRSMLLAVAVLLGMGTGVATYTFLYAQGASYLTNDPKACVNCHVMRDEFDGWQRSSHHAVATCNDCHAPHDTVGKLWVKAKNGFNHSWAFTTGRFHEPIQIGAANRAVTEQTCRHCHQNVVHAIDLHSPGSEPMSCIRCHANVGHLH